MWEDPALYQWEPNLETGHEQIDAQHKQLIEMVNKLITASSSGKSEATVSEALDFLAGYAVKHFADEEKLQAEAKFPHYENHKKLHDSFKFTVTGLVQRVKKEGPTDTLIEDVCDIVGEWLLEHIMGDDFRMAKFVKEAEGRC